MVSNPSPSTLGDVKLSYRFILVGLLSFISYQLLFYTGIEDLSNGFYRVNEIWTLAHLFILGFLITIIMGVMYQLTPVALLVDVYSNKLAKVQFWVYISGVIGLAYGLWVFNTMIMLIFGSLAFTGALLFVYNILMSVRKIKKWNMMSLIIVTAVFYFFMTVLFGLLLVINHEYAIWNSHEQILYSHITFGLFGWLSSLIIGFSYKMAPMFALAHGYSEKYAKWIYGGFQLGIISIFTGLFSAYQWLVWIGLTLILIGFITFALQIREMMKKKMKATLDVGFKVAIHVIYLSTIVFVISPIGFLLFKDSFILPFVYFIINVWIGMSILGYLFKIIPFLWWTDKYSEKVGKESVPMLKDMIDEKRGKIAFMLMMIGFISNAIGIGFHLSYLLYVTNTILLVGGILYSYLVLRIFKM